MEQALKPLICYTLNSFMINYTVHQVDHQRSVQQCFSLFSFQRAIETLVIRKSYKWSSVILQLATFCDYCFFFHFHFFNCFQMNMYHNFTEHTCIASNSIHFKWSWVRFVSGYTSLVFIYRIYIISRVYAF